MINLRSDFADEIIIEESEHSTFHKIEKRIGTLRLTHIKVLCEDNVLNKEIGDYISIEFEMMSDKEEREKIVKALVKELNLMMKEFHLNIEKVLVIGLGNHAIISDALGPDVAKEIMVTAHLYRNHAHEIDLSGTGNVAVMTPGVMGQTGLESADIVKQMTLLYEPDVVLVIDALATRNSARINRVIQISNTGIQPGSGVGNHRHALNEDFLEVPVLCIGVATVTSIGAILQEAMDTFSNDKQLKNDILSHVKKNNHLDLVVTPKSMDDELKQLTYIISSAINRVLHKDYENL